MSSLTSLGVNKNKKKFGPTLNKNKSRAKKPNQASTSSNPPSMDVGQYEPEIKVEIKDEPLTEEEMAVNRQSDSLASTSQPKVSPTERLNMPRVIPAPSPSVEPNTPPYDSVASPKKEHDPNSFEPSRGNTSSTPPRIGPSNTPRQSSTPRIIKPSRTRTVPSIESSTSSINPSIEPSGEMAPPEPSSSQPVPKRKIRNLSTIAPKKQKTSNTAQRDKGKESASSTAKKNKGKEREVTRIQPAPINIGVPTASTAPTVNEAVERQRAEKEEAALKKRRENFRLPENMRTLDDVTDPTKPDLLEKPMSYFTHDIDGVVSKSFKELETKRYDELEKAEKAKEMSGKELEDFQREQRLEEEKKKRLEEEKKAEKERIRKEKENSVLQETSTAPQVRLVNGQIVLDTDSLTVERSQGGNDYYDGTMEVVEESSMTKKVNSHTYGKRESSRRWGAPETELFYDLLSQFGTDFETISKAMPNRSRAQVRQKFNREEKLCPDKVTEYLIRKRKPADLEKFKKMAGLELENVPDDFHEMQLV